MLCRSLDDQQAGSFLKHRISMVLQIGNAACVLETVSDRDAFEKTKMFVPVDRDGGWYELFAGCFLLLMYLDIGWYGVHYFRCKPRECVFSPQHDDTHHGETLDRWRRSMISDRGEKKQQKLSH